MDKDPNKNREPFFDGIFEFEESNPDRPKSKTYSLRARFLKSDNTIKDVPCSHLEDPEKHGHDFLVGWDEELKRAQEEFKAVHPNWLKKVIDNQLPPGATRLS